MAILENGVPIRLQNPIIFVFFHFELALYLRNFVFVEDKLILFFLYFLLKIFILSFQLKYLPWVFFVQTLLRLHSVRKYLVNAGSWYPWYASFIYRLLILLHKQPAFVTSFRVFHFSLWIQLLVSFTCLFGRFIPQSQICNGIYWFFELPYYVFLLTDFLDISKHFMIIFIVALNDGGMPFLRRGQF